MPGVQAGYAFVRADGAALLRLTLRFDPAQRPESGARRGSPAAAAIVPAKAQVRTSCAATPLVAAAGDMPAVERLAGFFTAIAEPGARPLCLELDFALDRGAAALPADLFALTVQLDLGDDIVLTAGPDLGDSGDGAIADLVRFAVGFERVWEDWDGAGGMLKLAAATGTGSPALWCVRTSATKGIAIATPAAAVPPAFHALPPLSTRLLSGTWSPPDSEGAEELLSAIDLDRWWAQFLAAVERVSAPAMAVAVAERIAMVRAMLPERMSARLAPVEAGQDDAGDNERAVFAEAAADDLTCASAVAGVAIEVGRGAGDADAGLVLRGRVASPPGAAGAASGRPAALSMARGAGRLAFVVPGDAEGRAAVQFSARFEGGRLDHGSGPGVRLLLPGPGSNPLVLDIAPLSAPAPLLGQPPTPGFSIEAAAGQDESRTVADALGWTLAADMRFTPAPQDRLELALHHDCAPAGRHAPETTADGDLFKALAAFHRFESENPVRAGALEAEMLDRFATLAAAVADALPDWRAPVPAGIAPPLEGCLYCIDFAAMPSLSLTRVATTSGPLPPWPEIAGYATPAGSAAAGVYVPEDGAGPVQGLRILIPGLRLPAVREARLAGRIRRNLAGASTSPAFVYDGATASSLAVVPRLDWEAPAGGTPDPTLAAALDRLFAPFGDEGGRPFLLAVTAECRHLLAAADGPEFSMPILATPPIAVGDGDGAISLSGLKDQLAGALSAWRTAVGLPPQGAELRLTIALWDEDDREPLARLRQIPVPVPANDGGWWSAVEAAPR